MDEFDPRAESKDYDIYLNVRGLLKTHFGAEHGDEIYELLKRTAENATDPGMSHGIIFDEDGGEFVSLLKE
jgi:hypothetical protein